MVDHVTQWHQENIEADVGDSQTQWQTLVNCMGPFRQELRAVRLLLMDCGSIAPARKDEGLSMKLGSLPVAAFQRFCPRQKEKSCQGHLNALRP